MPGYEAWVSSSWSLWGLEEHLGSVINVRSNAIRSTRRSIVEGLGIEQGL